MKQIKHYICSLVIITTSDHSATNEIVANFGYDWTYTTNKIYYTHNKLYGLSRYLYKYIQFRIFFN